MLIYDSFTNPIFFKDFIVGMICTLVQWELWILREEKIAERLGKCLLLLPAV